MTGRFRRSMAWLHTWSGLVVGWVLLAIFVTGTASYYRADISRWMRPELAWTEPLTGAELGAAAERATAYLAVHAPKARSWFIGMPQSDKPVLDLFWRTRPGEPPGHVYLDPATGRETQVRDTEGGDFLYRFHFELHMAPLWGRWIVGLCAMIMLVALISGIVTHRRFFGDLFTFRRDKALRRSVLDAHNVGGVLALPFHVMITYTGVVTLATFYMPWGVTAAYRGDAPAFFADAAWITTPRRPANRPAAATPIGAVVERAVTRVAQPLERLTVVNPGDANATVVAVFEEPHGIARSRPHLAFDGVTGAALEARGLDLKPAARTFTVLTGLHEAHFARPALRLLFFLCGVMGSVTIATGIILWSLARLPRPGERPFLGLRLVQALNVGTVTGLPAAMAVYFLANRLLPVDLAGRAEWEIRAFFGGWIVATLFPLARPHRRAWSEGFAAAALLCCAVAAVDILTLPQHPLRRLGGDPLFLWFDAAILALAVLFAVAAHKVARYEAPAPRRRTTVGEQSAFPAAARPRSL
ncbi:PepSY-associated TM helix domain-containing protein [Methylobacterium sp. J-068]|uniref:PepSY-associated TM helix domain-containing protein n=1 Tax=Methylobacterium sp. J-068 TaxID=2836649 RepID=UPI001FB9A406|nr:PepSY-associated TM helix domain-containing protein [Methylobacterium sp. J-068]MCJ2034909.1 PepSY domain-containing protein [Methylobacterium sp. J-068]